MKDDAVEKSVKFKLPIASVALPPLKIFHLHSLGGRTLLKNTVIQRLLWSEACTTAHCTVSDGISELRFY